MSANDARGYKTIQRLVVGDRVIMQLGARVAVVELLAINGAGVAIAVRGPKSNVVEVCRTLHAAQKRERMLARQPARAVRRRR